MLSSNDFVAFFSELNPHIFDPRTCNVLARLPNQMESDHERSKILVRSLLPYIPCPNCPYFYPRITGNVPGMKNRIFRIYRGDRTRGRLEEYHTGVEEGMVVLDCVHRIQAEQANDLAVRWNCKAGKCGSCSMEINGRPRLACMTRMNEYGPEEVITLTPLKTFPLLKDLVTDVSWNYEQNKRIKPFRPNPAQKDKKGYRMMQRDVDRVQEFRKCIECYLCQNVCHVLRDHERKDRFVGPRFMIRLASLEMHPLDTIDRIPDIKKSYGSGFCNITRCCTDVCPEHINITDNGIIPLKERVVDRYYDPLGWLWEMARRKRKK